MSVEVIGIRHYSPACARHVAARITAVRPRHVLIEGPSEFNDRLDELHLAHRLPIAIYSYRVDADATHHGYAPFAEFSPEWVALKTAASCGAQARFIDLPFHHPAWRGQRVRYDLGAHRSRQRQSRVMAALCRRFDMDGDDALWDHLFEATPSAADFGRRLTTYFRELRGDDPGEAEDIAREKFMARHVAWARAQGGDVIVVCGGWHQPAIERQLDTLDIDAAPQPPAAGDCLRQGSFIVPYSDRQLDALGGYGAGMPSPRYYRWIWHTDNAGAAARATTAIVERLRQRRQSLSTAALVSARIKQDALARLRGHPQPLRCDVLDGLLDAVADGALDAPPPWSGRERLRADVAPQIREMLLALVGQTRGQLAPATPAPPLVAQVGDLLQTHRLRPGVDGPELTLDRRNADAAERSRILWQLTLLDIHAVEHQSNDAPGAARSLDADQYYLEHWCLHADDDLDAELIHAGAYGPDLASAAQRRLGERLATGDDASALADGITRAMRAGFRHIADEQLARLRQMVQGCHDHGQLARAGLRLQALVEQGFWDEQPDSLLQPLLHTMSARLAWLIDGIDGAQKPGDDADIDAVAFLDRRTRAAPDSDDDTAASVDIPALLRRTAARPHAPPTLRGACVGALWQQGHGDAERVAALARAMPGGTALGDFLCGLFALARHPATRADALIGALDDSVGAMTDADFLLALPALRQAFAWFPPRERGDLALMVARRHHKSSADAARLTRLPATPATLVGAGRLEARALAQAHRHGLLPDDELPDDSPAEASP